MTHEEALKEFAVEQYLLGELSGAARERFEAHLFDCKKCADDVREGILFLETAGPELRHLERSAAEAKATRGWAWWWQGWTLGPALAACLAVIVYQSTVLLPRLHTELAQAETPTVINPVVLANAGARGGPNSAVTEVVAPSRGFYLLAVDIPPAAGASAYRCSLYSPGGDLVWHVDVSPQQARDSVMIQVPVTTAREGVNELRVQSVIASDGKDAKLNDVTKYRYKLSFAK